MAWEMKLLVVRAAELLKQSAAVVAAEIERLESEVGDQLRDCVFASG